MILYIFLFFLICMAFYTGFILLNLYYFQFRLPKVFIENNPELLPQVTVVIPARNEEKWIGKLLMDLKNQSYPPDKLQVIVVDDFSTDATFQICEDIMRNMPEWKVIPLQKPQGTAFKKAAIQQAIQVSKGEIIITTDADCTAQTQWVQLMVSAFSPDTALVSGPVCMWDDGSWFQQFQALEFIGLICLGAGSMARNTPNMCNGANLAYRKQVFYEVKGFDGIDHIASGDDELLMHKIHASGKYSMRFLKSADAIIHTAPCTSFRQFVHQRIRWVSKSAHYKNWGITLIMSVIYLAILGIPLTAGLALWNPEWVWISLSLFLMKIIPEGLILYFGCTFFNKKYLLKWFLPEQILHIPYILWAGMAGNIGRYAWKDRKVN